MSTEIYLMLLSLLDDGHLYLEMIDIWNPRFIASFAAFTPINPIPSTINSLPLLQLLFFIIINHKHTITLGFIPVIIKVIQVSVFTFICIVFNACQIEQHILNRHPPKGEP